MAGRAREIVIIGGGIMGLAIAYHLSERGVGPITVLEKSYLCSGASGRNGGGVRAQWSTSRNVELMKESLRLCEDFAKTMRVNVWFRRGGYLFLARDGAMESKLTESARLQNELGLPTRVISPEEAGRIVPPLDTSKLVAASYNPDDAVVFPWPFMWGYAERARASGVRVLTHHTVTALGTENGRVCRVMARSSRPGEATPGPENEFPADVVINAAGAWSPSVAKLLGVSLPNIPHRHEICASEPLKPWLGPLVADLSDGLYFSQSNRGEIIGGIRQAYAPAGLDQGSSHAFLGRYCRSLMECCPVLSSVKIMRQWAGMYDITPDANPIVGFVDEVEGFYQVSGFMGHGFMMAPVVGKLVAEHIASGKVPSKLEGWNLSRYRDGKLLSEGMILG